MKKLNLRKITDFTREQLQDVLQLTADMKGNPASFMDCLKGKTMAMINEKQSLRTKVTFEAGIQQLGGFSVYLTNQDISLGKREPVKDVARNLSRWVDIVVARVFKQSSIDDLAEYGTIPVVNALSDEGHPCQAVADIFTIWEKVNKESLGGYKLTYIGDGNNVCDSLMLISGLLGLNMVVCTPSGYEPPEDTLNVAQQNASENGGLIALESDPVTAVTNAQAVYTDVWTSMGQEEETERRLKDFQGYQVNTELMANAPSDAIIMHCLPAHRGEEITDEVIESPNSVVFDQAENRLHAQKAIMKYLIDNSDD
jgi:ornithine carbamoyltransferase